MSDETVKQQLEAAGKLKSLIPVMPLLTLEGEPYHLQDHFQFEPFFSLERTKRFVLKCGRQVGKTQNVCGRNLLTSWMVKYFRSLFVLPRHEQAKRLSNGVMKAFVDESPVKHLFVNKSCDQSILERSYTTFSRQYFSFAFLDPDRIRSISNISDLYFDEAQDINWEFIPIIGEVTTAAKKFGFINFTGTPKTLDNTLTTLWEDSSQAEWITKCKSCNHFNIPDLDNDVLAMIGKKTCVCAKCGKDLDCSFGTYIHKFPNRRASFAGYHIPQIIHPLHYNYHKYPGKWSEILYKQRSYSKSKFLNEVLGIEYDSLDKLLTATQLMSVCKEEDLNTLQSGLERRKKAKLTVMGIDWGGGGEESTSFTAVAIGGVQVGSDEINSYYMVKFSRNLQPTEEAKRILELYQMFKPDLIAHDYGGAGALRETLLIQAGIPMNKIVPYTYVFSPNKPVISFNPPKDGYRSSYSLDKTRSLNILCAMIRAGKIKFPSWDSSKYDEKLETLDRKRVSLLLDFTHIQEETRENSRGAMAVIITKTPKESDDLAHAVNYMASSIWYTEQRYPDLADATNIKLTEEDVKSFVG
jgi:hypothetical protein